MIAEKLNELKKDLANCTDKQLVDHLLSLARLKKENKEMLSYLLGYGGRPLEYGEVYKSLIDDCFTDISENPYFAKKTLQKIKRIISKYYRFTSSRQGEAELYAHFLEGFCKHIHPDTRHKQVLGIGIFALKKLNAIAAQVHEDISGDVLKELDRLSAMMEVRFTHLALDEL